MRHQLGQTLIRQPHRIPLSGAGLLQDKTPEPQELALTGLAFRTGGTAPVMDMMMASK